jgi:hypothetical protein
MTNPTSTFFDDLARKGHVTVLEHEHGRVRFELTDSECIQRWTVAFDDGNVRVSRGDEDADAVIRADRALFDRAVLGELNLLSARLRGEVSYSGSLELLAQLGQLMPGAPEPARPGTPADRQRRQR